MRRSTIPTVQEVVALSLLISVTAALAPVTQAQSVSGSAYGALVRSPGGTQQSALAVLPVVTPTDGAAADEDADGLNVPGTITTEALTGTTSGSIGVDGARATSNALGSTFGDLAVSGVQLSSGDGAVTRNTRMALPGVG